MSQNDENPLPQSNEPRLRRSIGLRTVVSTSAGLTFASSTFLVVVQVAVYMVGDSAWVAIAIAGLLCALAAAAFSELNGMWPSVNGIRLYIQKAFGEKLALTAALTYMSVVSLVVGTEAYVLSHVLSAAMPTIGPLVWIVAMLTVATGFNFCGLKVAGTLQDVITYSVIVSILTMSVMALGKAHFVIPHPLATGGIGPVFQAVGVAIFLFVGFEWVTPLADEVRQSHAISRGMFIAIGILVVAYALITTAMFALFKGPGQLQLFGTPDAREAIPHVKFALLVFGQPGKWWMIATSLCMSLTTFNAGLIGISRFIYGMARDSVLPKRLAHLSTKFSTPDNAVLLVYAMAVIVSATVYFTHRYVLLVNLAAAAESFVYAFAAASLMKLRLCDSDRERPFRMYGGLWLPAVTCVLFLAIGVGVFLQPGIEFWGAGIVFVVVALGWWIYIRYFAVPRLVRQRAEMAAKRTSRRPMRSPE